MNAAVRYTLVGTLRIIRCYYFGSTCIFSTRGCLCFLPRSNLNVRPSFIFEEWTTRVHYIYTARYSIHIYNNNNNNIRSEFVWGP